jgi:uncharacterized protein (DUF1800 family)
MKSSNFPKSPERIPSSALTLTLVCLFALSACGGGGESSNVGGQTANALVPVKPSSPPPASSPAPAPSPAPVSVPGPASAQGPNNGAPAGIAGGTASDYPALTAAEASRFLAQATFGPTETEITALTQSTVGNWLNAQFAVPATSYMQGIQQLESQGYNINGNQNPFLQLWWTQAVTGKDQVRQRMAFALSQIYVASPAGTQYSGGAAAYYEVLNRNAFGNLRTLLEDVSKSWQMGIYLSHAGNVKENPGTGQTPDENYAREIMQLFSIGLWQLNRDGTQVLDSKGAPIPTYGQDEIAGMAKVFTGWVNPMCTSGSAGCRINSGWNQVTDLALPMVLIPSWHSSSAKKIPGRTLPAGQSGQKDLTDTLDVLFTHQNFCPFIGKQLIQRFTTSNPSREYVTRVTAACENDGSGKRGELKAMVRAILMDPDARSVMVAARNDWGKLREPVVKYAQFLRVFTGGSNAQYIVGNTDDVSSSLAQTPLNSPSVFNFFKPGYSPAAVAKKGLVAPEFQITNEATVAGNHKFMEDRIPFNGPPLGPNVTRNYASWQTLAVSDPAMFIDKVDLVLNAGRTSAATKQVLVDMVRSIPANNPGKRVIDALQVYFLMPAYLVQR